MSTPPWITLRDTQVEGQDGYIVLPLNLRSFPPSDVVGWRRDANAGFTINILNLLAYLSEMAGKEGIFESADLNQMGIWGHSIGGSIALRTMSVEPEAFKAAILYSGGQPALWHRPE
jgi:pimeloyl-ACP methyl ester carboxylesterase